MTSTTTPATTRGLLLPCPRCGEQDAEIDLRLSDLDTCRCAACEEEFQLGDVRDFIAKWSRVLTWVEAFPPA